MKDFIKVSLVIFILLYCQQTIGKDNCDIGDIIDTSIISSLRNTYKNQFADLKIDSSIEKWEQTATIISVVGLVLTLCGAIITLLQAGNGRAFKILVAVLGVSVSLLNTFRNNLPDGTYQTYQKVIHEADNIKIELNSYFAETENESLSPILFKKTIVSICENINSLKTLKQNYSTNLPFSLDWLVNSSHAASTITVIKTSGIGSTRIEAKSAAEKRGLIEIQKQIEGKIDSQLKAPIFNSLKQEIKNASMLAVQKESESSKGTDSVSYEISYKIDNSFVDSILKGISFPLVIFNTNFMKPKINALNKDLTDYGFNVSEQPAPRGPNSETNAIIVGPGVPIDAIKKTVELLVKAEVPIKAIIYPWVFLKSKLEEKQKFNLVQIGGTKMLEYSPNLSKEKLEKLKTITTQEEMIAFCRDSTEALKKSWGLK